MQFNQFHFSVQRKEVARAAANNSSGPINQLGISLPPGMTVVAVDGVVQPGAFSNQLTTTPLSSPTKSFGSRQGTSGGMQPVNEHSNVPGCSTNNSLSSSSHHQGTGNETSGKSIAGLDDDYFFPGAIKDANSLDWGLAGVSGTEADEKQLKRPDGSLKRIRASATNDIIVLDLPPNLVEEAEKKLRLHQRGFQCCVCFKTRETREVCYSNSNNLFSLFHVFSFSLPLHTFIDFIFQLFSADSPVNCVEKLMTTRKTYAFTLTLFMERAANINVPDVQCDINTREI